MSVIGSGITYSNASLGYSNLAASSLATVSASSEAAGYAKENVYDWRPFTWWKATGTGASWVQFAFASAQQADYFGVAAHDLTDQGASIKLQYSTDSGSSWNDATTAASGVSNRVIFKTFSAISASYWRIYVDAPTTVASIGIIAFGTRLDLQRGITPDGFIPPSLNRTNDYATNMSEKGQFLGRSIRRKTYKGAFSCRIVDPDWVRNYWEPFIDHAELKPFFFSWDIAVHSDEAVIAWMTDKYTPPAYSSPLYMSAMLEFMAKR